MYNKLFTKILDSSIWLESTGTRLVWLTLIASMDEDGFAQFASVGNLSHRARVPIEETQTAVQCLESPDTNSSDQEHEGRRIEKVPGGWMVLNSSKYRNLATRVSDKEKNRLRVAEFRRKKKKTGAGNAECNGGVMVGNDLVMPSEAEAEAETPNTKGVGGLFGEEETAKKKPISEFQLFLGRLFRRKETTAWSADELKAFKRITPPDADDLKKLEAYYTYKWPQGNDFRRRDLLTLLNNFAGELDRARQWKEPTAIS